MSSLPAIAPPRVEPNAWHAMGGIWRLTFWRFRTRGQLLAWAGLVLLVAVPLIAITRDAFMWADSKGAEQSLSRFFFDYATKFYLLLLVPLLSFVLGAAALREEMKPEGVDFVLVRPARRHWVVLSKYIAHLVCVQGAFLLPLTVLVAVGVYRHVPLALPALKWLLPGQMMAIATFTAFGFLSAAITARYFIIGLIYGAVVEAGLGTIPTQISRASMTHQVQMFLHPMLAWLNPQLKAELPLFTCIFVLTGFTALSLSLAAVIFSQRELVGAPAGGA